MILANGVTMFTQVKVCDLEALAICGIVSWLALLFYLPLFALVASAAKGQISVSDMQQAFSNAHWQSVGLGVFCLVMWTSIAFGIQYCWKRPAFFTVHPSGEWACRNPFYYALHRIHPNQPRQVKTSLKSWFDDDINETVMSGHFLVLTESAEPITFPYSGSPLPDGKPALFQELGYPADFLLTTDTDGALATPVHTWTASGPLIQAEGGL